MVKTLKKFFTALLAVMLFLSSTGIEPVYAATESVTFNVSGIPDGVRFSVAKITYVKMKNANQQALSDQIDLKDGKQTIDMPDPEIKDWMKPYESTDGPYLIFYVNGASVGKGGGIDLNGTELLINLSGADTNNVTVSIEPNPPLKIGQEKYDYKDVLDDAIYYGILVNTFKKTGHADTNVAAKLVDGSGNITLGAYTKGKHPGSCVIGETKNGPFSIDTNSATEDAIVYISDKVTLQTGSEVTTVLKTQKEINDYIDGLMDHVKEVSADMMKQDSYVYIKPQGGDANNVSFDLTSKPAGTYYLNGESVFGSGLSWSNAGFKLNADQTIVFNFTSKVIDLTQYKTTINGKSYDSPTSNEDAFIPSSHLVFNMPNAEAVNFGAGVQGVFIAPNATCAGSTSSGWLIADTFVSTSEWHMVWGEMPPNDELPTVDPKPTSTTATLEVTKAVSGTYTGTDEFTFTLSEATGNDTTGYTMPTSGLVKKIKKDEKATFDAIKFTKAGTYYFNITESNGSISGMSFDTAAKWAEVTVSGSGSSMSASVKYGTSKNACNDDSLTVTNTVAAPKGTLKITKAVTGYTGTDKTYKFQVMNSAGKWVKDDGTTSDVKVEYTIDDGDTKTFSNLPADTYEIIEDKNDAKRTNFILAVTGDGDVEVKSGETKEVTVTNAYTPKSGSIVLGVTKSVTGNTYSGNEDFKFTLSDGNAADKSGYTMPTNDLVKSIKNGATATFGAITFSEIGKYYFKIKETGGSTPGMTYDTADKYAEVVVTENADGTTLDASVKYGESDASCNDSSLTVTNTYSKITYTPEVTKVVTGTGAPSETYNFTLTDKSSDKSGESGVTTSASVTGAGTATFGEITYTKPGIYEYEIGETGGSTPGMTYSSKPVTIKVTVSEDATTGALSTSEDISGGDTTDHKIENKYEKPVGSATLSVKKEVVGNTYDGTEDFKFTLSDGNDAGKTGYTMPSEDLVKSIKNGATATFGAITFDAVGTYYFKITETAGSTSEMTYDTAAKYATVKVSKSSDGKSLVATTTYGSAKDGTDSSLTVKNKYSKITYTPKVVKVVDGADAPSETYNFTLTDKSTDKSGESGVTTTASVTGAGTATFGTITYTKPGTYEYEIGETGGSTDGMTYSTSKVTIKVTVSKDATTGELSTKETVTGGDTTAHEIKNVYVKPDGSATLSVKKEVIGNTYDGTEDFTFTLADANTTKTGYTMPTTNLVKTVNDGNAVSFDAITFDAEGTYYFTITESSGTTSEMTYDTTPKYATVKVTKSDDGKSLNTAVTYGSAKDGTDTSLTVQNKYSKTTYKPEVEKVVSGTGAPSEKYKFTLVDESTDKTGESGVTTTGERTGAGTVTFGEITYTKAGTYKYVISESKGKTSGMTYSSKPVTITVTVDEDSTTGKLTATPALSGGDTTAHAIENKFKKPTGEIIIEKTFSGDLTDEEKKGGITFVVKQGTNEIGTYTIEDDFDYDKATGKYTKTLTVDAEKTYTVTETNYTVPGYVSKVYDVTSAKTELTGNDKTITTGTLAIDGTETVAFENNYKENKGYIVIEKTFSGDLTDEEKKGGITFVVKQGTTTIGTYTIEDDFTKGTDGKYTKTLTVDADKAYTVTETNYTVPGYVSKVYDITSTKTELTGNDKSVTTGTVGFGDTETVKFENNYKENKGYIVIEKTFSGDLTEEEKKGGITFEVKTGTTTIGTYTIKDDFTKGADGKYTKTLTVDADKAYTVTETNYTVPGYVSKVYDVTSTKTELTGNDKSVSTGTIGLGDTETVKFENNYKENKGYIVIEKTFSGDLTDEEKKGGITFEVKTGTTSIGTYTIEDDFTKGTDGKYTKTLTVDADKAYTVTETNYTVSGYAVKVYDVTSTKTELTGDDKEITTGTVSLGGTETVAFENNYTNDKGNLEITKTIKGDVTPEEAAGVLTFTVTGPEYPKGKVIKLTDKEVTKNNDGTYTIKLNDIKIGSYTVEETTKDVTGNDVTVKYSIDKGTATTGNTATGAVVKKGETTEVDFENDYTVHKGYIVIEKTFSGDLTDEEKKGGITFVVKQGTTEIGTYTIEDDFTYDKTSGKYTKTLTVPANKSYTVTETNYTVPGYVTKVYDVTSTKTELTGTDKTITTAKVDKGETETVSFENNYTANKGFIVIEKTFSGDLTEEEKRGGITFEVKEGTTKIGTYTIEDDFTKDQTTGKYRKTLAVDADKTYTVTETNYTVSGYEVKVYDVTSTKTELTGNNKTVTTGKVEIGKTETVAFENDYTADKGKLVITKQIKGAVTEAEAAGALEFTVTDPKGDVKTYKLTDFTYDSATDTYKKEFTDVIIGTYKVEETAYDINGKGVTVTYSLNGAAAVDGKGVEVSAVVTKDGTTTVAYEDDYSDDTGNLEITKTIKGDVTPEEAAGVLTFTITGPEYPNGKVIKLTDKEVTKNNDGTYTIKLNNIKIGTYTVEETTKDVNGNDVTVKYSINNGTQETGTKATGVSVTKGATAEVDFENDYTVHKGNLEITKTIKGDVTPEEAAGVLTFTVTGPEYPKGKVIKLTDKEVTKNNDGTYTIKLNDIKIGSYTVEETTKDVNGNDVTVKYSINNGTATTGNTATGAVVKKGETTEVDFENDYTSHKGNLEITKTIKGEVTPEEAAGILVFTITGPEYPNGKAIKLTDKEATKNADGTYTIKLGNIKIGDYTIEETTKSVKGTGVTVKYTINNKTTEGDSATGVKVKKDETTVIDFENTYSKDRGTLKITKHVNGDVTDTEAANGIAFDITEADGTVTTYKLNQFKRQKGTNEYVLELDSTLAGTCTIEEVQYEFAGRILTAKYKVDNAAEASGQKFNATVKKDETLPVNIVNDYKKSFVSINKVDINGGKEIEGATLEIIDKNNQVVDSWKSGDDKDAKGNIIPHEIYGLNVDEEYILREKIAPAGYTIAADTIFTIDQSGAVKVKGSAVTDNKILLGDALTEVKISKVDITDQKELEGAKLEVIDKDKNVVESWKSGDDRDDQKNIIPHVILGLKTNEEYTLRETVAPEGYTIATDTKFTIDTDGTVKVKGVAVTDNHILVEDSKTSVKISKVDITDQKELEGAKLEVIEAGTTVESWKSGDVKDKQGNIIPHVIEGLKTGVEYTLRETVAPEGYAIATDTKFTIDEDGTVKVKGVAVTDNHILVEDAKTSVKISKVDITDQKEIEGAKLEVIEAGTTVESWKSGDDKDKQGNIIPHVIEGLKTGVEYTLRETVAPEGYTIATDTKFTITPEGKVEVSGVAVTDNHILVEDAKTSVKISKVDITDQKELEGAKLEVIEAGTTVESWKSGDDKDKQGNIIPHVIEGLKTGVEYTLRETVAPEGYTIATDTKFTITPEGKVEVSGVAVTDNHILVEDSKTSVKISKVDITDQKELEGAKLEVIEAGTTVESWKSGDDKDKQGNIIPHVIEGLKTGVEYTLRETVAPEGYTIATDTKFTITPEGKVEVSGVAVTDNHILVEDSKTSVKINKVDATGGKEVEGAYLEIIDKNGKTVESWKSGDDKDRQGNIIPHEVTGLKTNEEYTIRETIAPDGYVIATDTTFRIDENNKVTTTGSTTTDGVILIEDDTTKVTIRKTDITGTNEIEGAQLEIINKEGVTVESWTSIKGVSHDIIGKLIAGETYILRETLAPKGYEVANDITFTVGTDGKLQVVTMIDEYSNHNVAIKKTDIAGNEIVGATLTITDKDGNVVDGWTSNGTTHVSVLQPGTYTLTETRAPEGYEIAESITFTVDFDDNGDTVITIQGDKVTEVVMVDEDTPEDEDEHEDVPGREDDVSGNSGADTGDNSNLMLWLTIFFTSLVSGVTFFFVKKRRDESLS